LKSLNKCFPTNASPFALNIKNDIPSYKSDQGILQVFNSSLPSISSHFEVSAVRNQSKLMEKQTNAMHKNL
jgi:hypothetical protein